MFDRPDPQTWECDVCGRERQNTKPGASEASVAWMRCGECGERQKFICITEGDD